MADRRRWRLRLTRAFWRSRSSRPEVVGFSPNCPHGAQKSPVELATRRNARLDTRRLPCRVPHVLKGRPARRSRDQLLHVIGRHPCMTVEQLARLLGAPVDRVKRLEHELIQEGLLRRIEFGEVPRGGTALTYEEFAALGLVEITSTGRRRLAGWLGLELAAASR